MTKKPTSVYSFLLALGCCFYSPMISMAQCTNITTGAQLVTCVTNGTTPITFANNANISANLTGLSLAGITIDIGNGMLTITGNPTVNASTTFTGNGSSSLVVSNGTTSVTFTFNGTNQYSELNPAMDPVSNLYAAVQSVSGTNLPVALTAFDGILVKENVNLTWQTATELNNDKFIIESSTEGEVFNRIGEIDGAGTTTETHDYTFTHHTPSAGVNYYRLKQVDFDGTFEYSKVIAINAPGSNDIFAFPNPAKDKITLQYDYSKGAGNVQLYDGLGRKVNASIGGYAGNYEVQLPAGLAKGTYWLKVERGGKVQTVPVIKE